MGFIAAEVTDAIGMTVKYVTKRKLSVFIIFSLILMDIMMLMGKYGENYKFTIYH
ncbi:hypothetical protein KL86CIT2_100011 [uncultured Citrobacter sp.]|uniref:Uncharacterized protein n=1 Tax=uncultured Citrobacter sp. TaxID=200446 RepID=A0A212I319_9ENTR|nr:hypothetical protein KL86CIT2_100011 [uncultured Citrobacter sp.]